MAASRKMETVYKILKWTDIIAYISFLLLPLYVCYNIIIKIFFYNENYLALLLFTILVLYSALTLVIFLKTIKFIKKKNKKLLLFQDIFVLLLLLFAVYLDYFCLLSKTANLLDHLFIIENLIFIIVIIIFNFLTLLTLLLTLCINFDRKKIIENANIIGLNK